MNIISKGSKLAVLYLFLAGSQTDAIKLFSKQNPFPDAIQSVGECSEADNDCTKFVPDGVCLERFVKSVGNIRDPAYREAVTQIDASGLDTIQELSKLTLCYSLPDATVLQSESNTASGQYPGLDIVIDYTVLAPPVAAPPPPPPSPSPAPADPSSPKVETPPVSPAGQSDPGSSPASSTPTPGTVSNAAAGGNNGIAKNNGLKTLAEVRGEDEFVEEGKDPNWMPYKRDFSKGKKRGFILRSCPPKNGGMCAAMGYKAPLV